MARTWVVACAAAGCVALTASACGSLTLLSAASAPIRVMASESCPSALGLANGVSNSYAGTQLVAPSPTSGLICRYTPPYPFGVQPNTDPAALYRQVELTQSQAVRLAGVIDSISTEVPTGTVNCPDDDESTTVIALAYSDTPDIDLWYKDSGCQTLDNGRLRVYEVGNSMFYGAFDALIDAWAPPHS
jgi:hypothetical protein